VQYEWLWVPCVRAYARCKRFLVFCWVFLEVIRTFGSETVCFRKFGEVDLWPGTFFETFVCTGPAPTGVPDF
jgi:hypothetical protein